MNPQGVALDRWKKREFLDWIPRRSYNKFWKLWVKRRLKWGKVYPTGTQQQYSSCLAPVTVGAQMRGLAMLHHRRWINVVANFQRTTPHVTIASKEVLWRFHCQPFSSVVMFFSDVNGCSFGRVFGLD